MSTSREIGDRLERDYARYQTCRAEYGIEDPRTRVAMMDYLLLCGMPRLFEAAEALSDATGDASFAAMVSALGDALCDYYGFTSKASPRVRAQRARKLALSAEKAVRMLHLSESVAYLQNVATLLRMPRGKTLAIDEDVDLKSVMFRCDESNMLVKKKKK